MQGVGYRDALCEVARKNGVTGWVRNRADGSVEALVQGEAASVDSVIAWARRGPPAARVARIDLDALESEPGQRGFERRPSA